MGSVQDGGYAENVFQHDWYQGIVQKFTFQPIHEVLEEHYSEQNVTQADKNQQKRPKELVTFFYQIENQAVALLPFPYSSVRQAGDRRYIGHISGDLLDTKRCQ